MGKLFLFFELFQKGKEVANPEKWKGRQVTATALAAVLMVLMKIAGVYGYELPFDETAAMELAGGVLVVVNLVLTAITSKRAGFEPSPDTDQPYAPVVCDAVATPEPVRKGSVLRPQRLPVDPPPVAERKEDVPADVQPKPESSDHAKGIYFG